MTADIHAASEAKYKASAQDPACAIQAIHEALAAGPDAGPWFAQRDYSMWTVRNGEVATNKFQQRLAGVGSPGRPTIKRESKNAANAAFIAACNPEAITTILAALEARDAEIAALREKDAWRDISTAPRDGTPVLILCPDDEWPVLVAESSWGLGWFVHGNEIFGTMGGYDPNPTHWKPRPDPTPPEAAPRFLVALDEDLERLGFQVGAPSQPTSPTDPALKDRTVRAMLTHYEKWGDTEGFGQMVAAVAALFRGDGGKERKR